MMALNDKQTNIPLFNLIIILLLYHSMKMQSTLTIGSLWIQKDPFLLPPIKTFIILSLLMLLATLLSLTLLNMLSLNTFLLNMLLKRYSTIGLLNLARLNISSLIEVLKISIKIWLIFALSLILTTYSSPRTPSSP